jgi:hypothetical protein
MNADLRRKPRRGDRDHDVNRADRCLEEALDEALMNTFPASDPISIGRSTSIVVNYCRSEDLKLRQR